MSVNRLKNEFQRLHRIEQDIYSNIERRQGDYMRQMSDLQQLKMRQAARREDIKKKSYPEIVKHPYNNHIWVSLANFVDQTGQPDLEQIEKRRKERQIIRQEIQQNRQKLIETPRDSITDPFSQSQPQVSNKKKTKASWKLTRQLRRQQVLENKQRLRRIEENKKQKMSEYHKY